MDFKSVLSYIGVMLEIHGVLALIPTIVSVIAGDGLYFMFIITGIMSFGIGTIMDKQFKKAELNLGSAMVITALSFVFISAFGAVPYTVYLEPVDAVFESVSGFTTTGLSVINAPETLAPSLLLWRSFTQWIGGIGILVIFLILVRSAGISSYYLYKAEGAPEKLEASVKHSVRHMFKIFGSYSILGFILLMLAGLPAFDSLLLTFSSVSTGGFSAHSASIAAYENLWAELVIMFLMICGATSFFVHDRLFRSKAGSKLISFGSNLKAYAENVETRMFWVIAAFFAIFLFSSLWGMADNPMRAGIFQSVSAITTTGFSTVDITGMQVPMFLIIILMIIGGYAGSTAGGIKLVRAGIIMKSFAWVSRKISYPPEAVMPFKFGKKVIKDHEMAMVFLFACLYLTLLVIGSMAMIMLGYAPMDSLFVTSSAQGTVGFSTIDLAPMVWQGKLVLMILMLLGRLEIFPFLVLIYKAFSIRSAREGY